MTASATNNTAMQVPICTKLQVCAFAMIYLHMQKGAPILALFLIFRCGKNCFVILGPPYHKNSVRLLFTALVGSSLAKGYSVK